MQNLSVVLAHSNTSRGEELLRTLRDNFRFVHMVDSLDDVRETVAKHRAHILVLDLDTASLAELRELGSEFSNLSIVCTHRLPDEQMWSNALAAGAIDCCQESDLHGILMAVRRNAPLARGTAAA